MSICPPSPNGLPAFVVSEWLCCHEAWQPLLRAELGAWLACNHGLMRDELLYIVEPADLPAREAHLGVHGADVPGETSSMLKEVRTAK